MEGDDNVVVDNNNKTNKIDGRPKNWKITGTIFVEERERGDNQNKNKIMSQ